MTEREILQQSAVNTDHNKVLLGCTAKKNSTVVYKTKRTVLGIGNNCELSRVSDKLGLGSAK